MSENDAGKRPGATENGFLIGRDGYLFPAGDRQDFFDIVFRKAAIPKESFDAFRGNLQGRAGWASRNAVPYLHLIMPDKISVVPQAWPFALPWKIAGAYIARNPDLQSRILYPVEELALRKDRTVPRVGTPFRDHGSILIAAMLAQRFSYNDETAKRDALLGKIAKAPAKTGLDLGSRLSPVQEDAEDVFTALEPGHYFDNGLSNGQDGFAELRFNRDAVYNKRIAMFGDEFGRPIAKFLQFWFSEVYFFQTNFFHADIVDQCQPDFLLTEISERNLVLCQADDERPNFLLYPFAGPRSYQPSPEFTEALSAILSHPRRPYLDFLDKLSTPVALPPAAVHRFDGLTLRDTPDSVGLLAMLEAPREVPQKMPAFVVDLSGVNFAKQMQRDQHIHGSYLVQRQDCLLFGPNHLVSAEGNWSCEARAYKQQFLDVVNAPYYLAYPGARPALETSGGSNVVRTAHLAAGEVEEINEGVFLATPLEADGWARWVATVLPKTAQYRQYGEGRKFFCDVRHQWQRDFLAVCGITPEQLLPHDPRRTYLCRDVMTIEYSLINMTISEAERLSFFEHVIRYRQSATGPKKIFVSRLSRSARHPHYRVLQNEPELIAALTELGFTAIEPETMPIAEQIALFASADQVIALGGAGLFNTAFCAPGTRVVTIESSAYFIDGHAQYLSSLGMNYGIVFGTQDEQDPEPVHKKWTVNVGGTRAAIRAFMG